MLRITDVSQSDRKYKIKKYKIKSLKDVLFTVAELFLYMNLTCIKVLYNNFGYRTNRKVASTEMSTSTEAERVSCSP